LKTIDDEATDPKKINPLSRGRYIQSQLGCSEANAKAGRMVDAVEVIVQSEIVDVVGAVEIASRPEIVDLVMRCLVESSR
jgi:hypothetical protein